MGAVFTGTIRVLRGAVSTGAVSRRLILLISGALVAAVMLVVAMVPEKADAAPRFKIVKKTFSNTGQIAIPTSGLATPYASEIRVGGLKRGKIRDVNLTLKNFSHTYPDDVDVMVSHGGVTRTVMSDVGGGDDVDNITLKLDDEAANLLPGTSQLTSGTFVPTNDGITDTTFAAPAPAPSGRSELAGFDGKSPNGPWTLWVADDSGPDGGQFSGGWSVTVEAKVRRR